jgi:hypothetical protein
LPAVIPTSLAMNKEEFLELLLSLTSDEDTEDTEDTALPTLAFYLLVVVALWVVLRHLFN